MIYGCEGLRKRYGSLTVLDGVSLSFAPGDCMAIMAPSGGGKTTLFRLLAGLEMPDGGRILGFDRAKISMVFQENRLCEHLSPVTNVALVQTKPDRAALRRELEIILPADCLDRPASTLSGGMKRRTAIARAVLAPSDVLLLDEPFTGLDEETREKVIRFVQERQNGRLLLMTTHLREEAVALGAEVIQPCF
ncbi:MAG: ATP-binding cassette domain-containing protein [Clostridiales bacterium]|nr:ATP-binding cassette domain-containing protein [Clostridiales bacterium]